MITIPVWAIKLVKFGAVGISGMCIDFGITWVCKEKLHWNKFLANSFGFTLAVINNYLLNRVWTFESNSADWQIEFGKFVLVSLVGLGINNLLVYILHSRMKAGFYLSKAAATACVIAWNFLTNYFFTFR
jgi:putative flippase GtrA